MDVFENLNKQQIKAVSQIDGPMLVLAGAGSGKTTVLVRRIIYMIEQGILLVIFLLLHSATRRLWKCVAGY